jgi:hypothetical protein
LEVKSCEVMCFVSLSLDLHQVYIIFGHASWD